MIVINSQLPNNWFTKKDGGNAATPPRGTVISSLHIGHLKVAAGSRGSVPDEEVDGDGEALIVKMG